jgi:hypothetical protein
LLVAPADRAGVGKGGILGGLRADIIQCKYLTRQVGNLGVDRPRRDQERRRYQARCRRHCDPHAVVLVAYGHWPTTTVAHIGWCCAVGVGDTQIPFFAGRNVEHGVARIGAPCFANLRLVARYRDTDDDRQYDACDHQFDERKAGVAHRQFWGSPFLIHVNSLLTPLYPGQTLAGRSGLADSARTKLARTIERWCAAGRGRTAVAERLGEKIGTPSVQGHERCSRTIGLGAGGVGVGGVLEETA